MASMKLLLKGGTLIDGKASAPLPDAALLIEDGRIRSVGTRAEVEKGLDPGDRDLQTISVAGKTVMPGLIDTHCHINYGEVETEEELDLYTPMEYRSLRAVWNAQKVLRAGVTSICDPGSTGLVSVAVRDAIEAGMFEGPRVTAGRPDLAIHPSTPHYLSSLIRPAAASPGGRKRTRRH